MFGSIYRIFNFLCFLIYSQLYALYSTLSICLFIGYKDNFFHDSNVKTLKIKYTGDTFEKINSSTKVVIVNHLSWADCFIDNYILHCKGCYLSRNIMMFVVPFSAIYTILTRQAYFFNRNNGKKIIGSIINTICNKWNKILILYAEGTRNTTGKPIPLKYGGIKQIYIQKLPCQIMNISNKNKVIDEKNFIINYGVICNVIITKQIDPNDYNSLEEFIEEITRVWIENFQV
jgi:1-acyl-sn-glycerol-3-phosphate acyltransferase